MKLFVIISIRLFIALLICTSIPNATQYDPIVYKAQQVLNARGYNLGNPDGLWGKATEKAVKHFQVDNELPVTGRLDEETKAKLGFTNERRVALVIGNSDYKSAPLKNPVNDAFDMAAILRKLDFDVMHKENVDQRTMETAIRDFGRSLREEDVGLFYYAGHGVQVNGRNYLIPINAEIETESDVKFEAVNAARVLGKMEDAENDLNIVILDACRDNPYSRGFRTSTIGLARMDAPGGSIIAYSTSPGKVAADGEDRNGIYTKFLLKYIDEPGLTIEQILKKVRIDVINETDNKQVPWESSSLTGDFYFASRVPNLEQEPFTTGAGTLPVPPSTGASFYDLLKAAEEKKKTIEAWSRWQEDRKIEYDKASELDGDNYLTSKQKAEAWKRFLSAVSKDNPYSTKDNDMRSYAKTRIKHWQSAKPVKKIKPAPKVASIDPKDRAIGRDRHYIAYASGVVRDTKNGLEWVAGPDKDYSWYEAKRWIENLKVSGGGWRMPTKKELKILFEKGKGSRNMTPLLKTTGTAVWSSEDSSSAWSFFFGGDYTGWAHSGSSDFRRAFAVRSRK